MMNHSDTEFMTNDKEAEALNKIDEITHNLGNVIADDDVTHIEQLCRELRRIIVEDMECVEDGDEFSIFEDFTDNIEPPDGVTAYPQTETTNENHYVTISGNVKLTENGSMTCKSGTGSDE